MLSILLIFDLKEGKLYDSGSEGEGTLFHKLHVRGMNDDFFGWKLYKR